MTSLSLGWLTPSAREFFRPSTRNATREKAKDRLGKTARERVQTERGECGRAGTGPPRHRSNGTGATTREHRETSNRDARTNIIYLLLSFFVFFFGSWCWGVCNDFTGFVERRGIDDTDSPGALIVYLIVEDPPNVERFLTSVDTCTAVPNTDDRDRSNDCQFQ